MVFNRLTLTTGLAEISSAALCVPHPFIQLKSTHLQNKSNATYCPPTSFVVSLLFFALGSYWFRSWLFGPFVVWNFRLRSSNRSLTISFVVGKFRFVVLKCGSVCGQTHFRSLAERSRSFVLVQSWFRKHGFVVRKCHSVEAHLCDKNRRRKFG